MNSDDQRPVPWTADDSQLQPTAEAPPPPPVDPHTDPVRHDLRAEIGKYLSLVNFPATGQQIINAASARHAPETVLRELSVLPADAAVDTPRDLWSALGVLATGHR